MHARILSSERTPIAKFLLPGLWIPGFGAATWFTWYDDSALLKWMFLLVWIVGTLVLWRICVLLRQVRIDADNLHVSNFRRQITVPLRSISKVTENKFVNVHPITIHFRTRTEFGDSITFMPIGGSLAPSSHWRSHPVVGELLRATRLTART